jgi:hypothetical protein
LYVCKEYHTPLDFATDDPCRDLLEHHESVLQALRVDSSALVSAVVAHCAALSAPEAPAPETKLTLRAHQLDPSLLWVDRSEARRQRFSWVRDVYAAQVASTNQAFVDLPDDCAGDVFDFLPLKMTRAELQHIVAHCTAPEAHTWVCAVARTAVMVRKRNTV